MSHDLMQQEGLLRPIPVPTVAAIELRALSKTFGQLRAVDQLTLSVGQGEIFGLLGPNGSGKTTTINLIRRNDIFKLNSSYTSRFEM